MKYVVDTCTFNKLIDGEIEPESLPNDGEFIASHIQVDELNKTMDKDRRARLFLRFTTMVDEVVSTETGVYDVSRYDHSKFSDGIMYGKLKSELDVLNHQKRNNPMDVLILEIAIKNRCRLLTTDTDLARVARANGCIVAGWKG